MRGGQPMSTPKRVARTILALYLVAASASCGTLSVEEEKALGHQAQRAVRQQTTLMRDRAVVNYIRQLGAEIVAAARPTPFDVRWYVVEDEELNAFAIPGGSIYVNTGLIAKVNHADELVGVLAHELGHVTGRHVAQNVRRQRNTGLIATIFTFVVAILTGNPYLANAGDLVSQIAGIAYLNTFTRDFEREADALAIETLVKAGWNPEGMPRLFETMKKESGGGGGPQFLMSHPATDERIQNAKAAIAKLPPGQPGRTDDKGQLKLIQRRLELIIGSESESDPIDDEEDVDDDEE
jgi:predicted Zn-dependent protease